MKMKNVKNVIFLIGSVFAVLEMLSSTSIIAKFILSK